MAPDPSAIAELFELGSPVAPLRPLPGLSGADVWALQTDRGTWVVKAGGTPTSDAVRLEQAARTAGVSTAPPVTPAHYSSTVDGTAYRVWARIDGHPPDIPPPAPVATWLGNTIATIGTLALLPDTQHPPALLPDTHHPASVRRALAELTEVAMAQPPPVVLCHRDINRRNILVGPAGPVLLDFDHAGPQAPWWEFVHHTFLLACHDLGPDEPDADTVRSALEAYRNSNGVIGPSDRTAFGGLAGGLLHWYGRAQLTTNTADLRQAETSLPLVARSLDRWARLLA